MDLQPWMAQLSVAGALTLLLLVLGKTFINHVASQLRDERAATAAEIERLTRSWEARLADCTKRGDAWETAANRWQATALEDRQQVRDLQEVNRTVVGLLQAIREEQLRR
jgi:ABC-type protease/lipase transport system fused ATPase/permease subunit